jgi:hypothetical protein
MRRLLLLVAFACSGCKTAEFAVDHQMTGIHVAAKFEAKDFAANSYRISPSEIYRR